MGALAAGMTKPGAVPASDETESHGLSAFGDLKYPADFPHFDYVDPRAPKGGVFSQIGPNRQFNQNFLTFNSLNGSLTRSMGSPRARCASPPTAVPTAS